jgi:predicted acyl esterase
MLARRAFGHAVAGLVATAAICCPPARAAQTGQDLRFTASDGVSLQTTLTGAAPLAARPTIVEFSPYGRNSATLDPGPAYNVLLVQIRGTGDSDGAFDALGPRTQRDVQEVLRWACHQPWSGGELGLNGFSASAITIYNSLHLKLPCVKAAVLKSGTLELYRDLLWPGGVSNAVPGLGVLGLIGAPAAAQGLDRLQRAPGTGPGVAAGLVQAGLDGGVLHPTLDGWWRRRGFRGDVNHLPILMIDGFFDVESRGAFQAYQALRGDGAHLVVIGAHDGAPAGTDGGTAESRAWLDRYVRGVADGVEDHPRVQLWMSDGSRESDLGGAFVRYDASDWPVPGTAWVPLALDPAASGSAHSLNDGTLSLAAPAAPTTQSYPAVVSDTFNTDPPNTAIVGADGPNQLASVFPPFTQMALSEPLGLSYTTKPLAASVMAAGPLDLDLRLSTTAPETAIWAVVSDVSRDGAAHPLMAGRLSTNYPRIIRRRSLVDPATGDLVEPYGVYSQTSPPGAGQTRLYHVEIWPIGNRFEAGHRIRLDLVGASAASKPAAPGIDTVVLGGRRGSRLLFPVLPGSDLRAALR